MSDDKFTVDLQMVERDLQTLTDDTFGDALGVGYSVDENERGRRRRSSCNRARRLAIR